MTPTYGCPVPARVQPTYAVQGWEEQEVKNRKSAEWSLVEAVDASRMQRARMLRDGSWMPAVNAKHDKTLCPSTTHEICTRH